MPLFYCVSFSIYFLHFSSSFSPNFSFSYFSAVVTLRFEQTLYRTVEGDAVEVCVIAEGNIESQFTALVETSDISATG